MAIRINFLTQFDDRGIKRAQRDIANIGRNISRSLDFAVAGGLAALTAGLGKSVESLARIEAINAQTVNVLKSMGDAAGVTSTQIQDMAGNLEKLTATEAETIQEGANLLLTFGNIRNEAGAGNDIFNQTVAAMVDLGRAMGTDASSSAIQLGKALNDPTKGIAALTRVGVSFTQQQKDQVKALQASGDIMSAQKIILAELQNQFGGSGAAYAKTFSGQIDLMRHELGTMGEDIAMTVMPAMQTFIQALRDVIPEIGPKLKAAVESVNWQAVVDALVLIITNLDKIVMAVGGIYAMTKAFYALETGVKLVNVAFGIMAGKIPLNPIMLAVAAIGLLVTGVIALNDALQDIEKKDKLRAASGTATKAGQDAYEKYLRTAKREQTSTGPGSILPSEMIAAERARQKAYDDALKFLNSSKRPATGQGKYVVPKLVVPEIPGLGGTGADKGKSPADLAKEALDKVKESLTGMGGLSALTTIEKQVGDFQRSVVESFSQIYEKIADLPAKTKGLDKLRNFLKAEQAILEENARQRDAVIKKRSLAQSIIDDVRSTLMGSGNLASLMENQTKSVTTTVSKIVDGFAVTTKRTVDEVVGSKGVIGRLKDVVAKTKAFAGQLTDLKRLGLEPNLFKQIVDAGPEVGGELAKEILDGGSDSVKALNDTFKELQQVTADVSEQTATIMFDAGSEIGSALVDGLLAEEERLVNAAKQLADAFNKAYQENITALSVPEAPTVTPKVTSKTTNITNNVTVKATPNTKADAQKTVAAIAKYSIPNNFSGTSYRGLLK